MRSRQITTEVGAGKTCFSSCALIWLAGTERRMVADASIGFHAAFNDENPAGSNVANAVVGSYIARLGYPDDVVVLATRTSPDSIELLDLDTALLLGAEVTASSALRSAKALERDKGHVSVAVTFARSVYQSDGVDGLEGESRTCWSSARERPQAEIVSFCRAFDKFGILLPRRDAQAGYFSIKDRNRDYVAAAESIALSETGRAELDREISTIVLALLADVR